MIATVCLVCGGHERCKGQKVHCREWHDSAGRLRKDSRNYWPDNLAPGRPRCTECGNPGTTIDGRCSRHLSMETRGWLETVDGDAVIHDEMVLPNYALADYGDEPCCVCGKVLRGGVVSVGSNFRHATGDPECRVDVVPGTTRAWAR